MLLLVTAINRLIGCNVFLCGLLPPVMGVLLAPLAAYHRLLQHVSVRLEPVLQRLDFSVRGYMMSKPIDNQCKYRVLIN